jgi:hypothetical protein
MTHERFYRTLITNLVAYAISYTGIYLALVWLIGFPQRFATLLVGLAMMVTLLALAAGARRHWIHLQETPPVQPAEGPYRERRSALAYALGRLTLAVAAIIGAVILISNGIRSGGILLAGIGAGVAATAVRKIQSKGDKPTRHPEPGVVGRQGAREGE